MLKTQFFKDSRFILILIISTFILKGVFMMAAFPIFQGPDEINHFATIHYLSEPTFEKEAGRAEIKDIENNYPEEIDWTLSSLKTYNVRFDDKNTQTFVDGYIGPEEKDLTHQKFSRLVDDGPPTLVQGMSYYHEIVSFLIGRPAFDKDILTQFFLMRIFSIILGALIIYISYKTARVAGFSRRISLFCAAMISFQPMFDFMSVIVNYDILISLGFAVFLFGAACILRDGLDLKTLSLSLLGIIIAIAGKGTGLVLIPVFFLLLSWHFYQKNIHRAKAFWKYYALFSLALVIIFFTLIPKSYLGKITGAGTQSKFGSVTESLGKYLDISTNASRINISRQSYWGYFGWLDHKIDPSIIDIIHIIELFAIAGLILLLFDEYPPNYLPQKKFLYFFILIISLLQLGVRFFDWQVFDQLGKVAIGTPGRYFLPNIIPHFLLVVTGLGYYFRKKEHFEIMLKSALILMVALYLYSLFIVIIPRYYL